MIKAWWNTHCSIMFDWCLLLPISFNKLTSERLIRFMVVAVYQRAASAGFKRTIHPDQRAVQMIVKVMRVSIERKSVGTPKVLPTWARVQNSILFPCPIQSYPARTRFMNISAPDQTMRKTPA